MTMVAGFGYRLEHAGRQRKAAQAFRRYVLIDEEVKRAWSGQTRGVLAAWCQGGSVTSIA